MKTAGLMTSTDVALHEASDDILYLKKALIEERNKREESEALLTSRTLSLQSINEKLHEQYVNASMKNQEVEYLLKITNLELNDKSLQQLIHNFLDMSARLVSSEASFSFKCELVHKNIVPVSCVMFSNDKALEEINLSNFLNEKFNLLLPFIETTDPVVTNDFGDQIKLVNMSYQYLNHGYLFPIVVDRNEKYLIWLTFTSPVDFTERTFDLICSGIHQIENILQKQKIRMRIFENYKKLKEIKSQLIQSEKMASIGTISAGIAHEINNPLSFVMTNFEVLKDYISSLMTYIDLLENMLPTSDLKSYKNENVEYVLGDIPHLMSESLEGINRIKTIVNGLRVFSRADDGDLQLINVNTCVETSLKLVSNELRHKCKIHKNLLSKMTIKASEGQLIQVLTNLLVNSVQAIESFGEISIETFDDNFNVTIIVKDSGQGISAENQKQLFTPFFTTKPTGHGTGLGLSISYGIIKKHHGNINVESVEGLGTIFTITLPLSKEIE